MPVHPLIAKLGECFNGGSGPPFLRIAQHLITIPAHNSIGVRTRAEDPLAMLCLSYPRRSLEIPPVEIRFSLGVFTNWSPN